VQKELAQRSLKHYMRQAWGIIEPQAFVDSWHIDAIVDALTAVKNGTLGSQHLILNVPPRHSKSLTVEVMFPSWMWIDKPSTRFLCSSYAEDLSIRDSIKCRSIIQSNWYQRRWADRFKLAGDQNAKCLASGTQILMATGEPRSIETLKPGDSIVSVALPDERVVVDKVKHVWCNGVKPIRKITLSDGTIVRATLNHRFYGWDTWQYVEDLKVGDALAVVRRLPVNKHPGGMTKDEAFMLALWLSEGSKHECSYAITTADVKILRRLSGIASSNGWTVRKTGKYTYTMTCDRKRAGNTPMSMLKRYFGAVPSKRTGGKCASWSKLTPQLVDGIRIPVDVFKASDEVIKEFIGTYIACDGCVLNKTNHAVSITSVSMDLIYDFALLLKRFGVKSNIDWSLNNHYVYRGKRRPCKDAWMLSIKERQEVLKLNDVYMYSKTDKFAGLLQWCGQDKKRDGGPGSSIPPEWDRGLPKGRKPSQRHRWTSRAVVEAFAKKHGYRDLQVKLSADLDWRRVVSIEELPASETWHMETERTSTFIAEGLFSHNTRFNTDKGGYRVATSVGGMTTGEGGDIILIDDPSNVMDAAAVSERGLQNVLDWWDLVMPTRLNDPKKGVYIIIMQRCHTKDLTGHILSRELDAVHICLPAEYEAKHPHRWAHDPRTQEGELLCPQRFGAKEVDGLKRKLGTFGASGQLQQRPAPREGGMVKDYWFKIVAAAPAAVKTRLRFWDRAATEKKKSNDPDWTAGALVSVTADGITYVEHINALRDTPLMNQRAIRQTAELDGIEVPIWMEQEPGSAGVDTISTYSRDVLAGYSFRGKRSTGSKASFVDVLCAQAEAGNVYLVGDADTPWIKLFLEQVRQYPIGSHDDLLDAVAKAYCQQTTGPRARIREIHEDEQPVGDQLSAGDQDIARGAAGAVIDEDGDIDFDAVAEQNARRIYGDAVVDNWAQVAG
jgi:predicted phage terminase large subunit-like protein